MSAGPSSRLDEASLLTLSAHKRLLKSTRKLESLFGEMPPPEHIKLQLHPQPRRRALPSVSEPLRRQLTAPGSTYSDAHLAFPRSIPPILIPNTSSSSSLLSDGPNASSPIQRPARLVRKSFSISTMDALAYTPANQTTAFPRRLPPLPGTPTSSPCQTPPRSPRPLPLTPPEVTARVLAPPLTRSVSMISTTTLASTVTDASSPVTPTGPAQFHQQRVQKMAKLTRHLGERPPPELVFAPPSSLEVDAENDDDIAVAIMSRRTRAARRQGGVSKKAYIPHPRCVTRWVREVGSCLVEEDYETIVRSLREL